MTYRERREARAEKRRAWAESRTNKAAAASARAHGISDGIPLGQPILVGHHSERRARRDVERINAGHRLAHEHTVMAAHHEQAADTIERQLASSVYDDDPDALDRLAEKLATLEAEREQIKAYNAAVRKAGKVTPEALALLDDRQRDRLDRVARFASFQLGKHGEMPGYALSNLSGTIKRTRDRLERLQREQAARVDATFGPLVDGTRVDPLDRPYLNPPPSCVCAPGTCPDHSPIHSGIGAAVDSLGTDSRTGQRVPRAWCPACGWASPDGTTEPVYRHIAAMKAAGR